METWKVSGNATRLGSELKEELLKGSWGPESITEKLWEREFGKSDMSPRLGKVIPDVNKGKGAVQPPNGSESTNHKKKEVSYARSNL